MIKEKHTEKQHSSEGQKDIKDAEIETLKTTIAEKDKLIDETKNKLLRALADFDNFKKRIEREKEDIVKFSNEALIFEILPIVDGFERAIDAVKKVSGNEEIIKGIALVRKQLEDTLTKFGLKLIETIGKPFDPEFHEVIMQKESDGEEKTVLEEAQKGYTLFNKVIRPAMVIISKKKGEI